MHLQKTHQLFQTKWLLLLLLSTCFGFKALAQTSVSGRVINQKDNSSLEGVSVVVKGTTKGVITDVAGNFTITHTSNTPFTITISGLGFKSFDAVIDPAKGNVKGMVIALVEQYSKWDEIIVTGTSLGTTKRQMGSYVSSVSAEDISKGATGNVLAAFRKRQKEHRLLPPPTLRRWMVAVYQPARYCVKSSAIPIPNTR